VSDTGSAHWASSFCIKGEILGGNFKSTFGSQYPKLLVLITNKLYQM
jgi:hypothetical protein